METIEAQIAAASPVAKTKFSRLLVRRKWVFERYRSGAKRRGLVFDLTLQDFINCWGKTCSYCGKQLRQAGFDRVDSAVGYIKTNIVPCCGTCNLMKHTKNVHEFVKSCRSVVKNFRRFKTMEQVDNHMKKRQSLSDGTLTKAFFVKHVALDDFDTFRRIRAHYKIISDAATFRFILRKIAQEI